ncbi:hypothetical protein LSTR_LSTR013743 [Laodelphax striatellus]|uniref:Uncharacterized protein n=1 Tax=Laodelphax striatellus TaxID=195883 RepID=A0A482WEH6_LAOST|nr:hypothetical protein LSTR_LSTR013743 [Laodelphax striatellus]
MALARAIKDHDDSPIPRLRGRHRKVKVKIRVWPYRFNIRKSSECVSSAVFTIHFMQKKSYVGVSTAETSDRSFVFTVNVDNEVPVETVCYSTNWQRCPSIRRFACGPTTSQHQKIIRVRFVGRLHHSFHAEKVSNNNMYNLDDMMNPEHRPGINCRCRHTVGDLNWDPKPHEMNVGRCLGNTTNIPLEKAPNSSLNLIWQINYWVTLLTKFTTWRKIGEEYNSVQMTGVRETKTLKKNPV